MNAIVHKILTVDFYDTWEDMPIEKYGINTGDFIGFKKVKNYTYNSPDNPRLIYDVSPARYFGKVFNEGVFILAPFQSINTYTDLPFDHICIDYRPIEADYIVICFDIVHAVVLKKLGINAMSYTHDSFCDKTSIDRIKMFYSRVYFFHRHTDMIYIRYIEKNYGIKPLILKNKYLQNTSLFDKFAEFKELKEAVKK